MSSVDHDYFNGLLADCLKSFWDERGLGSRYRCTLVGVDRFKELHPEVVGKVMSVDEAFKVVKSYLIDSQVAEKVEYTEQHDFADVVKLKVTGCIHRGAEERLAGYGIEYIACPCANVLMYSLEQGDKFTTELAQVEREGNECTLSLACFVTKIKL